MKLTSKEAGSASQFPQNMPVKVLVAVTTHNNIISTNFGMGAAQGAFTASHT